MDQQRQARERSQKLYQKNCSLTIWILGSFTEQLGLDIWKDIIFDMVKENKLINANGYKEILPQMTDPTAPGRLGRDGLNENVHSYFVNILARGGLLQLFAFFYLYIGILSNSYVKPYHVKTVQIMQLYY